jgi:hypothetical protein
MFCEVEEIRLIDINKEILLENIGLRDKLRENLLSVKVLLLNIMGSSSVGIVCTGAGV